jgi:hypothetical protein
MIGVFFFMVIGKRMRSTSPYGVAADFMLVGVLVDFKRRVRVTPPYSA